MSTAAGDSAASASPSCRSGSTWPATTPRRPRRDDGADSASAISRASRRRRDCTCWPRRTRSSAARTRRRADAARGGRLHGARARAVSRRASSASLAKAGLGRRVHLSRRGRSRRQAGVPRRRSTCCRCRRTYDEPKGVFLLEAMASGVPVVQPRRGAFTEIVEKTGGGLLVAPDDPAALADGAARAVAGSRAGARRSARAAFDGVRAHYSIARSADRLLERRTQPVTSTPSRRRRHARRRCDDASHAARSLHLSKEYPTPRGPLRVLSDVSFSLAPGDAAAIMGPSGSGKSSLLYILGALEPPTSGTVTLDGRNPFQLRAARARGVPQQRDRLRLPGSLPAAAVHGARERADPDAGRARRERRRARRGARAADRAGRPRAIASIIGRASCRAASGSASRSPARWSAQPRLLLCDEPTGNLDRAAADNVASLLLDLHRAQQTHPDRRHAQRAARREVPDPLRAASIGTLQTTR